MLVEKGIVVLAGGTGRRMGKNKAFVRLKNKTLLEYVVEKVLKVSKNVVVVVGKNHDKHKFEKILPDFIFVLQDEVVGKGPLAGMVVGIKNLKTRYVAVVPCDTPFLNPKILQYLFVKAKKTGVDAVIPIWPNNNYEPLQAIYKSDSFLPLAENALKRNMLSILDVVKGLKKIIYIPVENLKRFDPNLLTFFNINTKKDLEKAAKIVEENLFSI